MKHSRFTAMPFLISLVFLFLLPIQTLASSALEHVRLGEARLRITPESLGRELLGADAFASSDGFSLVEIVFNDAGFFGPGNMTLSIVGGTVWSNFPAGSFASLASAESVGRDTQDRPIPTGESISITSPSPSTQVQPGDAVHVVVEPSVGLTLTDLVVVGPNATVRITSSPWEVDLPIPETQLGNFSIQASAKTAVGDFLFSQAVTLEALPAATIQSLRISPDPAIVLGIGGETQLLLYASFGDGVERRVDAGEATWSSNAPSTMAVNAAGILEARALGTATITATIATNSDGVAASAVRFLLFEDGFETADASRWSALVN
jgi:hypothetical protein